MVGGWEKKERGKERVRQEDPQQPSVYISEILMVFPYTRCCMSNVLVCLKDLEPSHHLRKGDTAVFLPLLDRFLALHEDDKAV